MNCIRINGLSSLVVLENEFAYFTTTMHWFSFMIRGSLRSGRLRNDVAFGTFVYGEHSLK